MEQLLLLLRGELVASFLESGLIPVEAVELAEECLFEIEDEE
jgi:hypothetical protein